MAKSLFDSLQTFDRKKLRLTETKITTTSGEQFIERKTTDGQLSSEKIADKTYGFVASVVEDLQVGEIFPGLIIGSQDVAVNLPLLQQYKVTHILNVACYIANKYPEHFTYKDIKILDEPRTHIIPHFEEAFEFINEGIKSGCVLVHCNAGVSRSATIVIAYLMKNKGMSLTEAHSLVKEKRPSIHPNPGFQLQLETYSERLIKDSKA